MIIIKFKLVLLVSIVKYLTNMPRINREILKVRILKLAKLKSTGSPADLAFRLGISKRSVKRIVSEIRDEGQAIKYCPLRRSYVTEKEYY